MSQIALIEDHDDLRELVHQFLSDAGYAVKSFGSVEEFIESAVCADIHLIILDLQLPGEDGISFSRRMRALDPQIGIVMTSGRAELTQRTEGYDAGADIYLPKPVEPEELLSAIRALARRMTLLNNPSPVAADEEKTPVLDLQTFELKLGDQTVQLTKAEALIIKSMSMSVGRKAPYWSLMSYFGSEIDARAKSNLEVRIVRLREKLVALGLGKRSITAIRGLGYQLHFEVRVR
jgi:DNA-binding response OmpR family regulator